VTRSVRNMRTPAGGARGRRNKLGTALLLLLGLFAGLIGFAPSASAHHPSLIATVDCAVTPGSYTVNFTSQAWAGDGANDLHNDVRILWGPESMDWPELATSTEQPVGSTQGATGKYLAVNNRTFAGTFAVTGNPGDVVEVIAWAVGPWVSGTGGNELRGPQDAANGTPVSVTLPGDCAPPATPSATATLQCAEQRIQLSFTGVGSATTVDIRKNDAIVAGGDNFPVPVGGPTLFDIPLAAGDEDGPSLDIDLDYADGTDRTFDIPVNCSTPLPGATAQVRCAENDILVTLSNTGTQATTADISKNGAVVAGGDNLPVPVGGTTFPVELVDADENTNVTIAVDFAVGDDPAPFVLPVDCEQPVPGASVELECVEGDVLVTLTNEGDDATTADISKNGVLVGDDVSVPVGGTTFPVELVAEDENTDVTITVDFAVGTDPEPFVVPVDCEHPEIGAVQLECAEGGVVVVLTNDGALSTSVVVAGIAVEVPAGAGSSDANPAVEVTVPVDENSGYDFTVVGDGIEQQFSGTVDCLLPDPSVTKIVCAAGGLNLVLRNTGDDTATFVVTSPALPGGELEESVDAGNTAKVLIPLAEGATASVLVTSGDEVLFLFPVTRECETVGGQAVTRGSSSLPRTGGNATGLLSPAGALLLAGAALVAVGRRRQPKVLS